MKKKKQKKKKEEDGKEEDLHYTSARDGLRVCKWDRKEEAELWVYIRMMRSTRVSFL